MTAQGTHYCQDQKPQFNPKVTRRRMTSKENNRQGPYRALDARNHQKRGTTTVLIYIKIYPFCNTKSLHSPPAGHTRSRKYSSRPHRIIPQHGAGSATVRENWTRSSCQVRLSMGITHKTLSSACEGNRVNAPMTYNGGMTNVCRKYAKCTFS